MRGAWIAALLAAAACGLNEVQGPPGREQIVVQGVLSTEASQQVLWIERTTPAGEPLTGDLRPLLVPPERVEVRHEGGAIFSFQPDPSNPARFAASFTPVSGQRYDLLIETGTQVIRGSILVPEPPMIVDPASDTVFIVSGTDLRVTWTAGSNPWIALAAAVAASGRSYGPFLVAEGTSFVFPGTVLGDTTIISVLALDSTTARLLAPALGGTPLPTLNGNLTGGAGFLGAVSADRLVVRRS